MGPLLLAGCGSGDSGAKFSGTPGSGSSDSGAAAGGSTSSNGGAGGLGTGTGSATGSGSATATGGVTGTGSATGTGSVTGAGGVTGTGAGGDASGAGGVGTGAGGTTSGGATGAGGATLTCADVTCTAPASCDASSGKPKCVCPAGYTDTNGDGSVCTDIDECATHTAGCDANATCANTPGSFTCTCNAPAYTGDGKTCTCASGYTEVGSTCLLVDTGPCTQDNQCANGHCVGGACCAVGCDPPGVCEKPDTATCPNGTACQYAPKLDNTACDDGDACTNTTCFNGQCVFVSGTDCSDTDQCTTDTCGASGCVHTPIDVATACDDGNPCTTDACDPALGCTHTDNNAAACTDGNPCTVDKCQAGVCVSTPKDCSNLDGQCTKGVCVNGTCQSQPANANGTCTQNLDACDASGKCNASGVCVGDNKACGSLASSCATCTSGANCYQGRSCTCKAATPPNIIVNGVCQPDTNECNANPCVALATSCTDPTPDGSKTGDYVCTCPTGYTGDGKKTGTGCVDINECGSGKNPCGAGVAPGGCNGTSPPGSYSCTCAAGYVSVPTPTGPVCSCDLGGTYALVGTETLTWSAVSVAGIQAIEASPPGGVQTTSWALRYQTVQSDGTLAVQTIPCGATTPTACDTFFQFAHVQYQPDQVWGKTKINNGFSNISVPLAGVVPGGTYTEPQTVALMGIVLDDPAGAWPPCRQCVGVNVGSTCQCPGSATPYTVTNKASWFDADEDTHLGVTLVDVPRGGSVIDGTMPDPPYDYTEPSECPRIATPHGTYGYSEWPGVDTNGIGFRTYQWYVASRVISALKSTSITFDSAAKTCDISGTVGGPDAGKIKTDARMEGCETCNAFVSNGCTPAGACSNAQTDSYDKTTQSQKVAGATFALHKLTGIDLGTVLKETDPKRAADLNAACAEVRASYCPAGKTCN